MKPDHERNINVPLALSAALRRLSDSCKDTSHWSNQEIPLGKPCELIMPLLAHHDDWAVWRGKDGRMLMGIGSGNRQAFSQWLTASGAARVDKAEPPFTFFGGRFDQNRISHDADWNTWPNIELYIPSLVLEWSSITDANPKVWTHAQHVKWAQQTCLALSGMEHNAPTPPMVSEWTPIESRQSWIERINALHNQFEESELEKVVLARAVFSQMKMTDPSVAHALYELLNKPSNDIVFALHRKNSLFLGCTPETLADVEPGWVLTHALAGTQSSHQTESEFIDDEKIRREHASVVDDVCEKLSTMSEEVTAATPQLRYAKALVHLETQIRAKVSHVHLLDVIDKLHPTPALGGSPTQPALEWLRENESLDRGWFGGPVGWFNAQGQGGCAVAIRSALITQQDARAFAGAGIVRGSDAATEWQETTDKLGSILSVFNGAIQ